MGVNHGGFDVLVAEKFLHRSNVIAGLQEVRSKAMTEGMGRDRFGDAAGFGRGANRPLQIGVVSVVAAGRAAAGIYAQL